MVTMLLPKHQKGLQSSAVESTGASHAFTPSLPSLTFWLSSARAWCLRAGWLRRLDTLFVR
jgi:hypothetical protein